MDINYICNKPISNELFPGRVISVKNVSRTAPVPSWVPEIATEYSGPVINAWPVDAAAARAEELAAEEARKPKPRHYYRRADLKKKFGVDDDGLNRLEAVYGLPKHKMVEERQEHGMGYTVIGSYEQWKGAEVDRWIEDTSPLFGWVNR